VAADRLRLAANQINPNRYALCTGNAAAYTLYMKSRHNVAVTFIWHVAAAIRRENMANIKHTGKGDCGMNAMAKNYGQATKRQAQQKSATYSRYRRASPRTAVLAINPRGQTRPPP